MNNNDLFLESIIHADHKICGYRLKPLSLFHLSMLERTRNPLLIGGEISKTDVLSAIIICSSANGQEMNRRFRKINFLKFFFNKKKALKAWESYWQDFMSIPEFYEKDSESRKANPLPFTATMMANLITKTGWRWDYVFYEVPVGLIIWLSSSIGYVETGDTNIVSDTESDLIDQILQKSEYMQ